MATEVVILNEEQLRTLVTVLYHQEVEAAKDIQFHSEPELVKYLHDCQDGYNHSLAILDESAEGKAKYKNNEEKAPISNDLFSYSLNLLDFALQCVRSYSLRLRYLKEIRRTTSSMVAVLAKTSEQQNMTNLRRMVKEVHRINKDMLDHNKRNHNNLSRLFSENVIKETDATFDQFLLRYKRRINIGTNNMQPDTVVTDPPTPLQELEEVSQRQVLDESKNVLERNPSVTDPPTPLQALEEVPQRQVRVPFEVDSGPLTTFHELDEVSQLQVWEEIVSANGLEHKSMTNFSRASGAVGGAMLLGMGATMAWDIHTSHNKINTVANDGFNVANTLGGGMIGSSVSRVAGGAAIFATTALMAADIYTSQNKIETAVKDSVGVVSSIGSAMTYNFVHAALMTGLAGTIEVTGALAACAIGGVAFLGAVAAAFLITEIGNHFYNLITGKKDESKAKASISLPPPPPPPPTLASDRHQIYVAHMPDGRALARQIAFHT